MIRSPSPIDGQLTANGQVWLLNPNGMLFGRGAQVNVGGLVATASAIIATTISWRATTPSPPAAIRTRMVSNAGTHHGRR